MLFPIDYYNAYSNLLNENSKIFVTNTTQRLERLLNKRFSNWMTSDFLDFEKFENKIKDLTLTARIHLLGIVKRYLKYKKQDNSIIFRKYKHKINHLYDELNSNTNKNKKTEKEKEHWISYKELQEKYISNIPKMKDYGYTKFRNYMVLGWYILQIPVRLSNIQLMDYIEPDTQLLKNIPDKTKNYITKINGIYNICYNNYKTAHNLGQLNFTIDNPHLINIIDTYIKKFKIPVNKQFLYSNLHLRESKICSITVGYAVTKIVKELTNIDKITVNSIRHSFLTEYYKQTRTIDEKQHTANRMGQFYHVNMADYYQKLD